jgi:hypothetical protein
MAALCRDQGTMIPIKILRFQKLCKYFSGTYSHVHLTAMLKIKTNIIKQN